MYLCTDHACTSEKPFLSMLIWLVIPLSSLHFNIKEMYSCTNVTWSVYYWCTLTLVQTRQELLLLLLHFSGHMSCGKVWNIYMYIYTCLTNCRCTYMYMYMYAHLQLVKHSLICILHIYIVLSICCGVLLCDVGFRHWVCGKSWLAVKDTLTHRPSSQG